MKKFITIILLFAICSSLAIAEEERRVLQLWSKGEDVTALQEKLIEMGYLDGIADGVYGEKTWDAVFLFQEQSGIEASGIADIDTQDAILSIKSEPDYILNTNTMKFHYPSCSSVDQMKGKNKQEFTGTRKEAIELGYQPCGICDP